MKLKPSLSILGTLAVALLIAPLAAAQFPTIPQTSPSTAVATADPSSPTIGPGGLPLLPRCVVKIIDEVNVSVQEPGLITALEVREGMTLESGAVVGHVDDGRARMEKAIAEAAYHAAEKKAQNDVEILHAEDASKVAEYEYRASLLANERSPNAVAQVKLNELALSYQKANRQIELAKHNREISKLDAEAKRVEVDAAEDEIRRRRITAPMSGQITEVPVHVGQWVQPGDVLFRLVRLDRLSVDGILSASDYAPGDVLNRPVTVETTLARGRRMQFAGKVTFVHPEIDHRGKFRIKAEIMNVAEQGQFLLFPGASVDMTLRLDVAPSATPSPIQLGPPAQIGRDPLSGSLK
jgi:multidrug efflux pump subunit AcrA (membrane-fusion protein)